MDISSRSVAWQSRASQRTPIRNSASNDNAGSSARGSGAQKIKYSDESQVICQRDFQTSKSVTDPLTPIYHIPNDNASLRNDNTSAIPRASSFNLHDHHIQEGTPSDRPKKVHSPDAWSKYSQSQARMISHQNSIHVTSQSAPLYRQSGRKGYPISHPNLDLSMKPGWMEWDELSIKVDGLPPGTNRKDIGSAFGHQGTITRIRMPESRHRDHRNHAYITFSPVPLVAFWASGRYDLFFYREDQQKMKDSDAKRFTVRIQLLKPRAFEEMVPSPLRSGIEYPMESVFRLAELDIGFLSQENTLDIMRSLRYDEKVRSAFSLTINLRFRNLVIKFPCYIPDPCNRTNAPDKYNFVEYVAEVNFKDITRLLRIDMDSHKWALVLPLECPPIVFKQRRDMGPGIGQDMYFWSERDGRKRVGEVTYDSSITGPEVTRLNRPNQYIDIGRWTTYRLVFSTGKTDTSDQILSALRDFNIPIISIDTNIFVTKQGQPSDLWERVDIHLDVNSRALGNLALLEEKHVHLPFEVRYQLEAAISQGVFREQTITPAFLSKLAQLNNERGRYINRARNILEYITDRGKPIYDPMTVFEDRNALAYFPTAILPEYCAWVRKVIVTPSTIYLSTPVPETTNRVLRQYAHNADRFLRVQFTDERGEGRLRGRPDSDANDSLFNRVFRTLQQGIQIGDRHFQFLAFGNSQIRENGAYFFCPPGHQSCDDIRNWMGDFKPIKNIAKYASRLGQCFSTTREPKGLPLGLEVQEIPDIVHNDCIFSDGVGIVSPYTANAIAGKLKMYNGGQVPSAYQFRLAGYKGLIVVSSKASLRAVQLRPSQKKFSASSKSIEIIRPSKFSVATLNRQTIPILSCLGVPDEVFIKLAEDQLSGYEDAMTDPDIAQQLLSRFVDANGTTNSISQMITDGFMTGKEPFVQAILQLWRAWSMKLLREKARIVVEQGAFVFGCIDETNTLRGHEDSEGADLTRDRSKLPQIFLQVTRTDPSGSGANSYEVITGICVVGRNPSLHPGDLRVVEAIDVDNSELRALKDVVVFPANGDRSVASMCSGGDLDGDDYFVIWDPRLIPEEWNHPPLLHDSEPPAVLDRDVTVTDITKFFVEYMKNDSLATIAHAHVAFSDSLPRGPKEGHCLELARLHSNAVDYVKTGRKAHINARLKPKRWPHFMEKNPRTTYHSRTVLGQLYDLVAKVDFTPNYEGSFDERVLRRYVLSEEILAGARKIKNEYDTAMLRIMSQREIKSEFEVWSTFVLSRPRIGTDYKTQEDMGIVMVGLRDRFVRLCMETAGAQGSSGEADSLDLQVLYPFIAAMYRITWEEVHIALQQCNQKVLIAGQYLPQRGKDEMPLISFPWIFDQELGRIATSSTTEPLELDEAPVPQLLVVDRVPETSNITAASLPDGRIFHRGMEVFTSYQTLMGLETSDGFQSNSPENTDLDTLTWNSGHDMEKAPLEVGNDMDQMLKKSSIDEAEIEMDEQTEEVEEVEGEATGLDALEELLADD